VQLVAVARRPVAGVAVALEVDGRQAQRPGGEAAGHRHHALVHAERGCERLDPGRHLGGERSQHQCRQHHELHHTGAELQVAPP
jgi:hypothetical protein